MSDTQLATPESAALAQIAIAQIDRSHGSSQAMRLTIRETLAQVAVIKHLMTTVMKDGVHFGPPFHGSDKKTLLKPGSELIAMTFKLRPKYDPRKSEPEPGHREYETKCILVHFPTGIEVGEGEGSCSTMEKKYRWRHEYDSSGNKTGQMIENPDPADEFNTVLKISCKRALASAVLTATAAGDVFAQEVDDLDRKLEAMGAVTEERPDFSKRPGSAPRANGGQTRTAPVVPDGDSFDGIVDAVTEAAKGVNQKTKKEWVLHKGTFTVGQAKVIAVTFDSDIADALREWQKAKVAIRVFTKPGRKQGDIDIVRLAEIPPAPAAEAKPDAPSATATTEDTEPWRADE